MLSNTCNFCVLNKEIKNRYVKYLISKSMEMCIYGADNPNFYRDDMKQTQQGQTTLKLVRTPLNVYFTAFKSIFLSLSMHLLPRMNVMLDFI